MISLLAVGLWIRILGRGHWVFLLLHVVTLAEHRACYSASKWCSCQAGVTGFGWESYWSECLIGYLWLSVSGPFHFFFFLIILPHVFHKECADSDLQENWAVSDGKLWLKLSDSLSATSSWLTQKNNKPPHIECGGLRSHLSVVGMLSKVKSCFKIAEIKKKECFLKLNLSLGE